MLFFYIASFPVCVLPSVGLFRIYSVRNRTADVIGVTYTFRTIGTRYRYFACCILRIFSGSLHFDPAEDIAVPSALPGRFDRLCKYGILFRLLRISCRCRKNQNERRFLHTVRITILPIRNAAVWHLHNSHRRQ